MDEIFFWVRLFNFFWSFVLFIGLLYYGVIDLLLSNRCGHQHTPPEMKLWSASALIGTAVIMISITEVLFQEVMGGYRVFALWPYLLVVTIALRLGAFRVNMHRISVSKGHCS